MKKGRIISFLLAMAMVAALMAGCNKTEQKPDSTTPVPTSGGTTTAEQTTAPEFRTFNGRKFTIGGQHLHQQWQARPDESLLEAEKQEIYDKFQDDLKIELELIIEGDLQSVLTSLMGGTIPTDAISMKMSGWLPLAIQGLILPYDDPRIVEGGLNVNDPNVFFQPFTQAHVYKDKVYGAMWNGSHFICEFGWCIYFNKQLVADAGVSNLYQVVRDGKWDWNYYRDLAKKTTKDYDGDGQMDVYGIGTFGYGTELFTKPGGEFIRDVNGKMTVMLDQPAALEALEFTRQFAYLDQVRHPDDYGPVHRAFTDGKVAMVWGEQWNTRADDLGFQKTEINYGLVPMPKSPDADYYANVLGGVYSISIFSGHKDENIKDTAYILSELGRRFTNDDWQETYRDVDLRGDAEALEMVVDYIWPHTFPDYTWASDVVRESFRNNIYLPMTVGEGTPVQLVEQYKAELQAEVDALFKQ